MDVELARAVAALRDELLEAVEVGGQERLTFGVREINLEFEVELRSSAEAKAGFKAWVVSAEGKAGISRARTHRVGITVVPTIDGAGIEIAESTRGRKGKFGAP